MSIYLIFTVLLIILVYGLMRDKQPVAASAETVINAPLQAVWDVLTDIPGWESWNPDVSHIKVQGDRGIGMIFTWKAGGMRIESTVTEYQPPEIIAWKGKTFGINAYHSWRFTGNGDTTHVYTGETFSGFLPWLLPVMMRREIKKRLIKTY